LCGGFTQEETEYMLIDLQYLGIDNLMALRGDSMRDEAYFIPTSGGHPYAVDLVRQIDQLNRGQFLHDQPQSPLATPFCIGVAGYPEKHMEAPSMASDLKRLKEKVDAGADYVVTQMFFDNSKYFAFVESARAMGIDVPIIPGIKPLAVHRHLSILPQVFKIDLPQDLVDAVESAKDNAGIKQVGIEWAIAQSKELKEAGVPVLHYYSMGKSENIAQIASALF
jgi:methylenetetrahydrofolate reductase (NADPH)